MNRGAHWVGCMLFVAFLAMSFADGDDAHAQSAAVAVTGDTIGLDGKRYCLFGIDAPEPDQRCSLGNGKTYDCGHIAKTALMDLLAGARVDCRATGSTRENCEIARCTADGFDLSGNMVHTGWALAVPSTGERYLPTQRKARAKRHGLWRGSFDAPWKWRTDKRFRK